MSRAGWAYQVAQADVNDVRTCDGIFAIVNGTPPDEGVMVEVGMAIASQWEDNQAVNQIRYPTKRS